MRSTPRPPASGSPSIAFRTCTTSGRSSGRRRSSGCGGSSFTKDQTAPLTAAAYDVACGGVEAVPHAAPANLAGALQKAKSEGLWVLGTSEHEDAAGRCPARPPSRSTAPGPGWWWSGNEEKGLRRRTLNLCDDLCRLPPGFRGEPTDGVVGSLNAAVATGAMLAALSRPLPKSRPPDVVGRTARPAPGDPRPA